MINFSIIISLLVTFSLSQNFSQVQSQQQELLYTSTSLIARVDFQTLKPSLSPLSYSLTQIGGPLGYFGPLGPLGPLGVLGPVGSNTWNPSQLITGFEWSELSNQLTLEGGPLSIDGPLGHKGPLNPEFFNKNSFQSNSLYQQLIGLGIFSCLGPLGPLGALGPLGPLGPIGAHGFKADSDGQYINSKGKIQREINVNYNETTIRTYELFEIYSSAFALSNPSVLDTSFIIKGSFGLFSGYKEQFTFTSNSDQIVNIVLVPEKSLDEFKLTIFDSQQNKIDSSNSSGLIQYFTLQVKKGQQLSVEVQLQSSLQIFSKNYRLIVVGSTPYLNINMVTGNHIRKYNPTNSNKQQQNLLRKTNQFLSS